MKATLFVVPASHPSRAVQLMLERKGIAYRRLDLMPALHKPIVRLIGFDSTTVPALRIAGRRLQDSIAIARFLDDLIPEPPLFPSDPSARAAADEAERWGAEELQPLARRVAWWALGRDRSATRSFLADSRLGVPTPLAARLAAPVIWAERRINSATDAAVRADLAALPAMIERVDALVADGVLGGAEPLAADYQIATSIRLLLCFDDLRPLLDGRPAAALARRIVPDFPGHVGNVLPQQLQLEPRAATGG